MFPTQRLETEMSDWERRQRYYDWRAQRMEQGYPSRLSELDSCVGCVLKLVFFCFLALCVIAALLFAINYYSVHTH